MSVKKTMETDFGTVHFFEKSIRIDGIAETLYIDKEYQVIGFLRKVFLRGRKSKLVEIQKALGL